MVLALAWLGGMLLRGGHSGLGPEGSMFGVITLLLAAGMATELLVTLQQVQAREIAVAAINGLPKRFRRLGRMRIQDGWRRVVIDQVVKGPKGRVFAIMVDGSTLPAVRGDRLDGLGRLIGPAKRAAQTLSKAAKAGALPRDLGMPQDAVVCPCILVVRRPLVTGERDGVLSFTAAEMPAALGAEPQI